MTADSAALPDTPDEVRASRDARTRDRRGRRAVEKRATALTRLAVEYVAIDAITANQYNPNRQSEHDFDLLLASMREDGFTQPIVVQRATNEIVDGEHRWRAAATLGMSEIPVVYVDMSPEQMRIATLRHNRARGSEDIELTAEVLRDLRELGALDWAQDSLLLDDVELQRLLDDVSAPDALAGEEFGQAWEPSGAGIGIVPGVEAERVTDTAGVTQVAAMTQEALKAHRAREEALKAAKSQEEREQIKRDTDLYRVVLVFHGEEAEIVKNVLGDTPAERLLELCRDAMTN